MLHKVRKETPAQIERASLFMEAGRRSACCEGVRFCICGTAVCPAAVVLPFVSAAVQTVVRGLSHVLGKGSETAGCFTIYRAYKGDN